MLSVCIIAKNEEKVLEACLLSVAGIADEIIFLDTGSTDKTISIAEKYNCRIYHYKWDGNFTRARNTACSYATHDWIFCIDCDERLKYPERVLSAIASATPVTGCIIAERHNHTIADDGELSNEMRGNARLFRNIPEVYWRFEVHEETWSSCINNGLQLIHSNIVFDHEVGLPGYEGFMKKQDYYNSLLDKCIKEHNEQHYLFHSAKTQMLFGNYTEAISIFEKAETAGGYQVHNDAFIKCYKGYSAFMEKQMVDAEIYLLQALELIPGLSAANFYLIELYLRLGQYEAAYACANNLVLTEAASKPLTVADVYFTQAQVNYWKAFILLQQGNTVAAQELLQDIPVEPNSTRSFALQSRMVYMQGDKKGANDFLEKALACSPQWQQLHNLKKMIGN